MKNHNDSFLKMIGMSDASMMKVKPSAAVEPSPAESDPEELGLQTDLPQEEPAAFDFAVEFLEDTEKSQSQESAEVTESTNEQSRPGALVDEVMHEDWAAEMTEEFTSEEGSEPEAPTERRSFTQILDRDVPAQTNIYGDPEAEVLLQELQQDVTEEDRLLEGLEEAEASRATDIFAKSFRADSRKTRAHHENEESFAEFDQSHAEPLSEESSSGGSKTLILGEADALDVDGAEDLEQEAAAFSVISEVQAVGDPSVEDPLDAIDQDAFDDAAMNEALEGQSFRRTKARHSAATRKTAAFHYETHSEPATQKDVHRLVVIAGEAEDSVRSEPVVIERLPFSIGRDPQNDFSIQDSNASRFHCEVRDVSGQFVVVDLNSTNGIKVNDEVVTEKGLRSGDILQIGNLRLEYLSPGATSSALEKTAALAATMVKPTTKLSTPRISRKAKRMSFIAAGIAAAFLLFNNSDEIRSFLADTQDAYLAGALESFPESIAEDLGQPIASAPPEEVKAAILARFEDFPFPDDYRQYLNQAPARIFQMVLSDPELFAILVENAGDITPVFKELRERLVKAFQEKRNKEALELVELLLLDSPKNSELLDLQTQLKDRLSLVKFEEGGAVTEQDKEAFIRAMTKHQKTFEDLVEKKEFAAARKFASDVQDAIMNVIKSRAALGTLAESAVAEWKAKIRQMEKSLEDREKRQGEIRKMEQKGDKLIASINDAILQLRFSDAYVQIEDFIRKFPDHPDIEQMRQVRDHVLSQMQAIVEKAKTTVADHAARENYSQAWKTVYEAVDQVGANFRPIVELRQELDLRTAPRAAQFYNQARVFEFEADDLVAAEQYYKKALETVDPKSDLAAKANRGYAAIKRKNLQ